MKSFATFGGSSLVDITAWRAVFSIGWHADLLLSLFRLDHVVAPPMTDLQREINRFALTRGLGRSAGIGARGGCMMCG